MFFLKTKGTDKIIDFLEIRDNNFALVQYIKLSTLDKKIPQIAEAFNMSTPPYKIIETLKQAPFGQIIKLD